MGLKKHQPQGANPSIKSGHSVASMIGASKSAFKMKGSSFHMTQGQEAFVDAVAKKNPTAAGKIAKGIDSPAKNYGKIVPQMKGPLHQAQEAIVEAGPVGPKAMKKEIKFKPRTREQEYTDMMIKDGLRKSKTNGTFKSKSDPKKAIYQPYLSEAKPDSPGKMKGDPNKRMDKLSAKHKSLYDKFEKGQTSESEEARMHRLEDRMDRVGKRVKKKESKEKSPLNKTKEERKAGRAEKKAARVKKRADRREKTGGTRVGNAIRKGKEVVDKVKNSKVGKVAKGIADTVSNVKSGKIGAAIKSGKQTIADAKSKKSDSPAEMKTPLKQGIIIKNRLGEGVVEAGGQVAKGKASQQSSKPGKIREEQSSKPGKALASKIAKGRAKKTTSSYIKKVKKS